MNPLKICSWNINGIRSIEKPLKSIFESLDADIVCLQETKSNASLNSQYALVSNYNAYFSHPLHKSGYSGVALFCRNPLKPIEAWEGLIRTIESTNSQYGSSAVEFLANHLGVSSSYIRNLDNEGRMVCVRFPSVSLRKLKSTDNLDRPLVIISVYVPRLNTEYRERLKFKYNFELALKLCIENLLHENHVVVAGDINVCHRTIDSCDPSALLAETNSTPSRQWFNSLLVANQQDPTLCPNDDPVHPGRMVDLFRLAHPTRQCAFSCWCSRTNARETNYGMRIDHILCDKLMLDYCAPSEFKPQADLMPHIEGSDHCPIWAILPCLYSSELDYPLPGLCSHYWPQCQGKQIRLDNYLSANVQVQSCSPVLRNSELFKKRKDSPSSLSCSQIPKLKQTCLKQIVKKNDHPKDTQPNPSYPSIMDNNSPTIHELLAIVQTAEADKAEKASSEWKRLLCGPKKPPLCKGHSEPCVLRKVKQTTVGNRLGRRFWVCARPQGAPNNPAANCNHFAWDD